MTQEAYKAILLLGENGGWEDLTAEVKKTTKRKRKDEVNADAPGDSPKEFERLGKTVNGVKADFNNPTKKSKVTSAKNGKTPSERKPDEPESDLPDLSSLDEGRRGSASTDLDFAAPGNLKPRGKTDGSSSAPPGLRRSTRRR